MNEQRSSSQILFGFLPEQTVDLQGRVWRVVKWINPYHASIDQSSLRRGLMRAAAPWAASKRDGGYVEHLAQGREVEILTLNLKDGVAVEPFPKTWICKKCSRLSHAPFGQCRCGSDRPKGQLHFVGYCDKCGAMREPFIRPCPTHKEVRVIFPGTSSGRDIRFECPTCQQVLRKGFGFPKCECGQGVLVFNVHRSASVFTPRTVVVVNAPSPERIRDLTAAGGPARALSWVIEGMQTRSFREIGLTRESLVANLEAQGITRALAESMAEQAGASGQLAKTSGHGLGVEAHLREEAEAQAVTIALAMDQARTTVGDLQQATEPDSLHGLRYRSTYPVAIERSHLEAVELIDSFPVLTGNFGYTRGKATAGESRLVPYKDRSGRYAIYAELGVTEALFFRLHAGPVIEWLGRQNHQLKARADAASARLAVVNASGTPELGASPHDSTGALVTSLVHSFAHRMIRLIAVHSGIDRDALSELLVPAHLGFFIFAAARGEFVLGGLQAVFENGLDDLLNEFLDGENRCPLDPGCARHGGACMACLHIGEPSCRYFNTLLDRQLLDSPDGGFLRIAGT